MFIIYDCLITKLSVVADAHCDNFVTLI